MFNKNSIIEPEDNWVSVFAGDLNRTELNIYLDEPGGKSDFEPISLFSKDIGRWYDHDYIWCEASDMLLPVEELCRNNGIDSEELITEIMKSNKDKRRKCIILIWNYKVTNNRTNFDISPKVECLGSFEHEAPFCD